MVFCAHVRRNIVRGGMVHLDILFVRGIWGCECSSKRRHQHGSGQGTGEASQTDHVLRHVVDVCACLLWPPLATRALTAPSALPCTIQYRPQKGPLSRAFALSGAISLSMFSSHLHLFPLSAPKSFCEPTFWSISSVMGCPSPGQLLGRVLYATSEPNSRILRS